MEIKEKMIIGQNNCISQFPDDIWNTYGEHAVFSFQEEEKGRIICFAGIKTDTVTSKRFVLTHEDDWDFKAFSCVEDDGTVFAITPENVT